jgi:transposase
VSGSGADRSKAKKKGSNDDWTHPHDADAKITKMKDGRTHLAHKAEHAIDLDSGAIVGVTVQGADEGDTTTIQETLPEAAEQLEAVAAVADVAVIEEVVADKGYHSHATVHDLEMLQIRTYISEPDRVRQSWMDQEAERDAVYSNRRRIRGDLGKRLLRRRGELLERPCAHLYETGGLRRAHVRGHENVLKRLFVHAGAFNLGLWMRTLFGVGTPRSLVERWFATLTEKQIKRGAHRSTRALEAAIREYLTISNGSAKPFVWTKTADEILAKVAGFCQRISNSGQQ